MTFEELIAEGRKLERPCLLLRPHGEGPVVAVWHERDRDEIASTGHRAWLTVDARHVPGLSASTAGYLTIFTDQKRCQGGRVEQSASWPKRAGTPLYTHAASVLPPIDAVFARGSQAVADWLTSHGNENSPGAAAVEKYEDLWMKEFPLYSSDDSYAVLGGWHMAWPEDDWHEFIDGQLMVFTLRDSEPWVEAWHMASGEFRVVQRIT